MVAVESKKFFKEGFVKGGFTDSAFQPWQPRRSPLGGKKVLIGKDNTLNLMQSIRTLEQTPTRVRIGSDLRYAATHNEGAEITVTTKMRKYWWAKYYEFAGRVRKTKGGKAGRWAANVRTNAKAEYCRNMALMKAGSKIRIPQRRFIGESRTLIAQFEAWWAEQVNNLNNG